MLIWASARLQRRCGMPAHPVDTTPKHPDSPRPHAYTSPAAVSSIACRPPAATCRMRTEASEEGSPSGACRRSGAATTNADRSDFLSEARLAEESQSRHPHAYRESPIAASSIWRAAAAAASSATADEVESVSSPPACGAPSCASSSESFAPPRVRCDARNVRQASCHGCTTRVSKAAHSSGGMVAARAETLNSSRPSKPSCSSTGTTSGQERSGTSRLSNV
mmetsp:Transcript_22710/g.73535  ORF Transcript_22710/g.73535 Transcript_22710/m.73535 type:complete len:222 (+) Transcript_22710:4261-4926(+)